MNGAMIESSKAVAPWRQDVKFAALNAKPDDWDATPPMSVSVVFRFKRPRSHIGKTGLLSKATPYPTSLRFGDIDKLSRSVCDALADSGACLIENDKNVVNLIASKRFTIGEEPQGATITITTLSPHV